jgi:HD-GYP domain-containing protein (c-di-GMP phosphodiesterase class II)
VDNRLAAALTYAQSAVDKADMSLGSTDVEHRFLAATLNRDADPLSAQERAAEWIVGVGFALAATALWVTGNPDSFDPVPALASLIVLAIASRVRFEVVFGFTVPTQLAFVPLVFAMPVAMTPVAVVVALAAGRLPEAVSGRTRPSRLVHTAGNSWFAIGPAALFTYSGTAPVDAGAALLMGALCAQFAGDFCASVVRDVIATGVSVRDQLVETWVYAVDAALSPIALAVGELVHTSRLAPLAPLPLLGLLAVFAGERRQRLEGLVELSDAYRGTALVLGDVVEADDCYTGEHSRGVVRLSVDVGAELGLDSRRVRNVEFAALLHDVGKIAIPNEIINKPGKLEPHEWQVIKTHTVEGQRLLNRVGGFMREVGLIVRSHHERWDGQGYPDALAGEAIPLEGRIIACCDAWNAMRTDRAYRKALPLEVALAELRSGSGSQFDPRVVDALLSILEKRLPQSRTTDEPNTEPVPSAA